MNPLFPAFLKLHDLPVLIAGGGPIGFEKLTTVLINCPEAKIRLVASEIDSEIIDLAEQYPKVELRFKPFAYADLVGIKVVIAASEERSVNQMVYRAAQLEGKLINVADTPEWCDFYLGSVVRKGDLKIAISTNGKSPMLARRLRQYFEQLLPDTIPDMLENLHFIRGKMKGSLAQKFTALKGMTDVLRYDRHEHDQTI